MSKYHLRDRSYFIFTPRRRRRGLSDVLLPFGRPLAEGKDTEISRDFGTEDVEERQRGETEGAANFFFFKKGNETGLSSLEKIKT